MLMSVWLVSWLVCSMSSCSNRVAREVSFPMCASLSALSVTHRKVSCGLIQVLIVSKIAGESVVPIIERLVSR